MALSNRPLAYLRIVRFKQWLKNVFVLVPLFFSGDLLQPLAIKPALLTFAMFCAASSAVYVFNDLIDRAADARHPKKRYRMIASGQVKAAEAFTLIALLLAIAAALAWLVPAGARTAVVIYLALNIGYSVGLKRVSLIELFLVASGFVLRVIAGAAAIDVVASSWLLAMTGVIALLIVTAKRRSEIAGGFDADGDRRSLRSYNVNFLDSLISMLSGMTLIIYLLFTTSEYASDRFGQGKVLLTAPVVAFGVIRYIQLTKVGEGADDPTELILKDPAIGLSLLVYGILFATILYL